MKDRSVAEFLAQFDGDPVAAVHAIRDYIHADTNPTPRTTAPDTPVMIRVDDLHKSYKVGKQRVQALSGASLNIHKGEFIALTGSSGSGKSTLLQLIGGLDKPSTGKVVVDGVDLATLSDARLSEFRGSTIGFVFQFFYLQPFLRLTKNIEVPGMFAHTDRHQRSQDALRLLQKVGLEDRAAHYPREISGGQCSVRLSPGPFLISRRSCSPTSRRAILIALMPTQL